MTFGQHLVRLGEVAKFMGGSTPLRARPQYFGGSIPWVKTTDLNNGPITRTEDNLTELGLKDSSCKMVPAKAVLVAMYGGFNQIGRTGLLTHDSAINQALTAIIPNSEKLDPAFLLEWLNFRVNYWKRFAGSSRKDPNITKGDVADFPVPSIPVEQQRASVIVLEKWNLAIKTVEKLIAAKELCHRALHVRLLGRNLWSESCHERADALFEPARERNRPDLPVLAVTQDQGVVPRAMLDRRITMELSDPATFKVVRKDDFVISLRSFQGGLEHSAYEGLVSPAYTVLRCGSDLNPSFYRHYLKSPDFLKRLAVAVIGIRDGKQINFTDFASIKLPLPQPERQARIAAILDESEKEIALLKLRADQLRMQKRGLMQKILTGRWRVRVPQVEVA